MGRDPVLDYARPTPPRRGPYWTILFAAWISSYPLVRTLDEEVTRRVYGGTADGGAAMLAMFAIVPAVIVAAFAKRRWWIAAAIGGVCAPLGLVAVPLLF